MFISKSNLLLNTTPVIIGGGSGDVPSNLTNPDYSLNYTAGNKILTIRATNLVDVSYVAVCANVTQGVINVKSGDQILGYYFVERPHVCMFVFEKQTISQLNIVVASQNNVNPTVSYVAAGDSIQIPNGGETAGYNRQWLTRGIQSRTQTNELAAPVANLRKRVALSGSLSLPNMTTSFARDEWQQFLDYAQFQPFFICEQPDIVPYTTYNPYRAAGALAEASYICFNPRFSAPSAHNDTRALQNLRLRFDCYNGL